MLHKLGGMGENGKMELVRRKRSVGMKPNLESTLIQAKKTLSLTHTRDSFEMPNTCCSLWAGNFISCFVGFPPFSVGFFVPLYVYTMSLQHFYRFKCVDFTFVRCEVGTVGSMVTHIAIIIQWIRVPKAFSIFAFIWFLCSNFRLLNVHFLYSCYRIFATKDTTARMKERERDREHATNHATNIEKRTALYKSGERDCSVHRHWQN